MSALVQLYFADTAELSDPGVLAEAMDAAASERRARAQRTRSDAARAQILTAGLLLRRALSAAGVPEAEQDYAAGPFGKPYLPARPDVHFSLSHSGSRVLCAVADRPVGCDIQEMRPCSLRLAERWYTDAEQQRVFSQTGEDARLEMFYRIWTLKESFIKYTGRLDRPIRELCFSRDGDTIRIPESRLHCAVYDLYPCRAAVVGAETPPETCIYVPPEALVDFPTV